jgi:hypothetical protein
MYGSSKVYEPVSQWFTYDPKSFLFKILSGGSYGYEDLKVIMADTRHNQHQEMKEWILESRMGAGPWDPDHFDSTKVVFRDRD